MKKIFKSLKFRILAGLALFLTIIFYIFGYFFLNTIKQGQIQSVTNSVATAIKDLQHEYNAELNNTKEFEDVKQEFDLSYLYVQVTKIQNDKHIIIAKSNDLKTFDLEANKLNKTELSYENIYFYDLKDQNLASDRLKVGAVFLSQHDKNIILQCAIGFTKNNDYVKYVEKFLIFSLLSLVLFVLVVVFFVISKSLSETKKILTEVENIKIDGKEIFFEKTGVSKEIDDLIVTFGKLINELQRSYKKVKEFGQNASHELKTPLTIIRGEVEIGLRKNRTDHEYRIILKSVIDELDLLQSTVEKILFLSSNADADIVQTFTEVYVDEILVEAICEKQMLANDKNIQIKLLNLEPTTSNGSVFLLKTAIANIIENAIKYSNENSSIEICLSDLRLTVKDFGIGIAAEEITKIFDRFYRVDKTRNHAFGSGLGLSIVKTICDLHNIKIDIESQQGVGTTMTLTFETQQEWSMV